MAGSVREHAKGLALHDVTGPFLSLGVLQISFPWACLRQNQRRCAPYVRHTPSGKPRTAANGIACGRRVLHELLVWPCHLVAAGRKAASRDALAKDHDYACGFAVGAAAPAPTAPGGRRVRKRGNERANIGQ